MYRLTELEKNARFDPNLDSNMTILNVQINSPTILNTLHFFYRELQENLIRSHAAGVGKALTPEKTRMLLALRINVLAKGYSGIRLRTLKQLIDAFNGENYLHLLTFLSHRLCQLKTFPFSQLTIEKLPGNRQLFIMGYSAVHEDKLLKCIAAHSISDIREKTNIYSNWAN